jgi:hypothetical protein
MPEPSSESLQPHDQPWFSKLLGLFGRQERAKPVIDDGWIDTEEWARQQNISSMMRLSADRTRRYEIFDEMDNFGLVQAVLTAYAEETTQIDYDKGKSVWLESRNDKMISAGEDCLHNLQIEDKITGIARRVSKYGDAFQRLMYATNKGVLGWRFAPTHRVERVEDKYGRLLGFKQTGIKYRNGERAVSWAWDYIHFRMLGKDEESGYGTGFCSAMFRPWRQMTLTQDASLMFRLRRAPDRNLVLVNVGNMEEHEAMEFVNKWRKKFRKTEHIDPASPAYQKQYNPLTPLEDIFLPFREGQESRVETLSGGGSPDELYDLNFFRDEFFGAVGAPKAYFGFEGDINAKATLQQQDVRWARACKRLRKSLIYGLRQGLDIHFTLLGDDYNISDPANAYTVQMSPISYLDEFERLELMQLRYQIVDSMSRLAQDMQLDARVWSTYVLLNYAKLPEDLVMKLISSVPKPGQAPAAGAGVFASVQDDELRGQILDSDGDGMRGIYDLSEAERVAVAKCIHNSPGLRKIIGDIRMFHNDDILEVAQTQTDSSLLPPRVHGQLLTDSHDEDEETRQLREDLNQLIEGTLES